MKDKVKKSFIVRVILKGNAREAVLQ